MIDQNEIDKKKAVRKSDLRFAGFVLILYTICCILFGVGTFFSVKEDKEYQRANATATEAAMATQFAYSTATSIAHVTEQAEYEFVDHFNEDTGWLVRPFRNDYFVGSSTISGGIYNWKIDQVKKTFVYWADSNKGINIKDFDMYVDTRIIEDNPGDVCSGLVFRKPSSTWDGGAYIFSVCTDSFFNVYYHKQDEWESLSGEVYSEAIKDDDWNRLEVSARGDHFVFTINNVVVFEMTDDRQPYGRLTLYIEVNKKEPVSIWFDNFGLQRR